MKGGDAAKLSKELERLQGMKGGLMKPELKAYPTPQNSHPKHKTLNTKHKTHNTKHLTLNLNARPETLNP